MPSTNGLLTDYLPCPGCGEVRWDSVTMTMIDHHFSFDDRSYGTPQLELLCRCGRQYRIAMPYNPHYQPPPRRQTMDIVIKDKYTGDKKNATD